MIGIDRNTGKTLTGFDQFVSRVTQIMTTRVAGREKRRTVGSRVPETLGKSMSNELLMLAQSFAIQAFYKPINGIDDYKPSRCVAQRHGSGMKLYFDGLWLGQRREFEVIV